jgi:hypothetical protein
MAEIGPGCGLLPYANSLEQLATEAALIPSALDDPRYLLELFVAKAHHARAGRPGKLEWLHYARTIRSLIPGERRDRVADPATLEAIGRLLGELQDQAGLADAFRVRVRAGDVRLVLGLASEAVRLRKWLVCIESGFSGDPEGDALKALRGESVAEDFEG